MEDTSSQYNIKPVCLTWIFQKGSKGELLFFFSKNLIL